MNLLNVSFSISNIRLIVVVLSLFMGACGGSDGETFDTYDGTNPAVVANELDSTLAHDGTWSLADKLFISGGERLRTQSNHSALATIIVGEGFFDDSNGVYSGGRITIVLTLTGSGVYTVSDIDNVKAAVGNGSKMAFINVTAGTISNNETQWTTTATSGTVTVVVNSEGRYYVSTIEPLMLTRTLNIGTGIPGSPDQVLLSMRNINGLVTQ